MRKEIERGVDEGRMRFYKSLYVGESIKDSKKVCSKLKRGAGQLQVYVITLAGGDDQLEFYHCAYLQQKALRKKALPIIGIAGGRQEALELIQYIVEDVFLKTGNYHIKEYFLQEDAYK